MYKSFDGQIVEIISLLRNYNKTINNLNDNIETLEDQIDKTLNIELDITPEGFVASTSSDVIITCNIDKICDNVVLKIDDETVETYENINSFVGEITLDPEQVDSHKITIVATKGENTFIKNKVILPLN